MKDYYKVLGVSQTADTATIKKAYKELAKKHHPDLNQGDDSAEARFKEVGEAYEVLSSKMKRAEYDRGRNSTASRQQKKGRTKTAPVGAADFEEMMRNFSNSFSDESIKSEAKGQSKQKDPFHSDELFKKFMGFK